jgi:hypothetical protein
MSQCSTDFDDFDESGFCDLCKSIDPSWKLQSFTQFYGVYCRDCYELTHEDADEDKDENYIISSLSLRVLHETSYKGQRYYHKLCMNIISKK